MFDTMLPDGFDLPYYGEENLAVKASDPIDQKPQPLTKTHVKLFNLSDPEQLKSFEATLNQISILNLYSRGAVHKLEYQYDSSEKTWRVLVIWLDYYLVGPEEAKNVLNQAQY